MTIWRWIAQNREKKIAALGIKIKKWVSYHGIAINVSPDLAGFNNIVPCGIKEFGVTTMAEILGEVDEKKFESEKTEFSSKLLSTKKQEYFVKFLEDLKRKSQ